MGTKGTKGPKFHLLAQAALPDIVESIRFSMADYLLSEAKIAIKELKITLVVGLMSIR
jgi:hypothetical protein